MKCMRRILRTFILALSLFLAPMYFASAQSGSFSLSFTPTASAAAQGGSVNTSLNIPGLTEKPVILAVSQGLPAGITVKFSPTSCKAPCNSIMTVTAALTALPGTYAIPVIGAEGGETETASYSFTVNALPKFNYSLSLSSDGGFISTGESVSATVNLDQLSGTSENVALSASGAPTGVTAKFSTPSCKPPCSATVTFTVSSVTHGSYPITISAAAGSITREEIFLLEINPVALSDFSISLTPSANVILKGGAVNPLVSLTQLSGTSQNVTLTVGNQIANATAKISPASCKPPCNAVLSIAAKTEVKTGIHTINIIGSAGGITRNAEYKLIVIDPSNPSALSGSAGASTVAPVGQGVSTSGTAGTGSNASASGIPRGYVFARSLYRGASGEDVTKLQMHLASDPALYPEGLVTGYFGALTEKAVGRFQLQYGILSSATADGYGTFGPRTRAKLNTLFAI